jgi:hypothetical protein
MKKTLFIMCALSVLFSVKPLLAQRKLAITDKSGTLSAEVETLLHERLMADSIELTSMVDMRRKCDYWFASLFLQENELVVSLMDCQDKPAGTKNLGSRILGASNDEKALLIYYALSELINAPYKNLPAEIPAVPPSIPAPIPAAPAVPAIADPGKHRSRYFFAPSAYNLEEGELYYNSLYFLVHDVQYGVNDKFSIGMGSTVAGFPFYLTPKVTFPIDDKSAFALGDMLIIGTWGTKFSGNLLYGTYSRGGDYNNISFGGGHLFTGEGDLTSRSGSLVMNISGLAQMSDHIYFITENYGSRVKLRQMASIYYESTQTYLEEYYSQNMFFIYGLTGFRFINKTKDVVSWQVGLSYFYTSYGDIPVKYRTWYTYANEGKNFMAIPVVGFSKKFSTRY